MNKYEIILDISKTCNISETSRNLNYTQSAISQALKSFERELGFKIFKRKNSGVELLPVGIEIIKSLEKINQEENKIKRISDSMTKSETGTVRIGSFFSFSITYLPKILTDFKKLYPLIKFEISTGNQQEIYDQLKFGKIDIAITSSYKMDEFSINEIIRDEFVIALPNKHKLAEKISVSIYDIKNFDYILSGEKFDFEIGEILSSLDIKPNHSFEISDEMLALKLIEHGFGISIHSKFFLDSIPNHADISIRKITEHYYRSIVLATNPDMFSSSASDTFVKFVTQWIIENKKDDYYKE